MPIQQLDPTGNESEMQLLAKINANFSVVSAGIFLTASLPTPTAALRGISAFTSDAAAAPANGAVATGGGALLNPVYCDGAAWRNG